MPYTLSVFVLAVVSIFDSFRDIKLRNEFYKDISITTDKLYVIKSLCCVAMVFLAVVVPGQTAILIFLPRPIFLLIVQPCIKASASKDLRGKLKSVLPLPHESHYSNLQAKNYYYGIEMQKLEKAGKVISNVETVSEEGNLRRKKLDGLYPESIIEKLADMAKGDKEVKERRKAAEAALTSSSLTRSKAYICKNQYEYYPQLINYVMSNKGFYSLKDMMKFEELEQLRFSHPVGLDNSKIWGEFFVIQALKPLVADGTYEHDDFNDHDPLDNHAYRYAQSTVKMPSTNASDDPRLAL